MVWQLSESEERETCSHGPSEGWVGMRIWGKIPSLSNTARVSLLEVYPPLTEEIPVCANVKAKTCEIWKWSQLRWGMPKPVWGVLGDSQQEAHNTRRTIIQRQISAMQFLLRRQAVIPTLDKHHLHYFRKTVASLFLLFYQEIFDITLGLSNHYVGVITSSA